MLALVSTPIIMPRFRPDRAVAAQESANVRDVIWNLHSILVNPASTPAEAKRAKQRMLGVLDEIKDRSLPQRIVPAMTFSSEPAEEVTTLLDDIDVCGTCKRPISPRLRNRATLNKRARARSLLSLAPKTLTPGAGFALPNAARANPHSIVLNELPNEQNSYD